VEEGRPASSASRVAAVHMEFEKETVLWGRIASHIQTDKTLNFLFEHARKNGVNLNPHAPHL